jgi:hypothetical protein
MPFTDQKAGQALGENAISAKVVWRVEGRHHAYLQRFHERAACTAVSIDCI